MFDNEGPLGGPRLTDKAPFAQSSKFNQDFGLQTNDVTFKENTEYCLIIHGEGRTTDYMKIVDDVTHSVDEYIESVFNGELSGDMTSGGQQVLAHAATFGVGQVRDKELTIKQFKDLVAKRLNREGIPYADMHVYEAVSY